MKKDELEYTPAFLRAMATLESSEQRLDELTMKASLLKSKIDRQKKVIINKYHSEYQRYKKE